MIRLDRLPQPHTQMLVADTAWQAEGGTSAGKVVHLHDLGVPVRLMAPLADDEHGRRVRAALPELGLDALTTEATEHYVNLMTPAGERISIYTTPPATTPLPSVDDLRDAAAGVLDLASWTRDLAARLSRDDLPIWTDLHDIGPDSEWHEPFWRAATVVQCSDENLPDPAAFLHRLVDEGVGLAICTLGARGPIAVDSDHAEHRQDALACEVVDTKGAGDAFFAGVLSATLDGLSATDALAAGSRQATRALATREIGPGMRPPV